MIKGSGDFIDPAIEDPKLRELDWHVSFFVFVGNLDKVLAAKWRRIEYIQKG